MSLEVKTEGEYAKWRGCSVRTLQRERSQRIGPPFIELGKKIYYHVAAIDKWLLSKEQSQVRGSIRA